MGYYSMAGSIDAVLPVTKLIVKGEVKQKEHIINWEFEADETIKETILEYSNDGNNFKSLNTLSPAITNYTYKPFYLVRFYYRVTMIAAHDDRPYYSNIISCKVHRYKISLLYSNMVSSTVLLNINGNYGFQLMDETGRLLQRGKLTHGLQ